MGGAVYCDSVTSLNHKSRFWSATFFSYYYSIYLIKMYELIKLGIGFRKGQRVKLRGKEYTLVDYHHYRLEWFNVELKDAHGSHNSFQLKAGDLTFV